MTQIIEQPASAEGRIAAEDDTPVFDRGRALPKLVEAISEWVPPKKRAPKSAPYFRLGYDIPTVEHRIRAGQAWYSSGRFSGQHANDNQDWPLAKLLKTEGHDRHMRLAERYRELFEAANNPVELVGKDIADNIYIMSRTDLDASTGTLAGKGAKIVRGKKARLEVAATRAVAADPDKTKKRAKPMPKKWEGDWPLLHRLDAGRALAAAQSALGWLREAFESAVCSGETLEAIGRDHGIGTPKGASAAGRVLVFLGFDAIEQHWQRERMAA